MPRLSVDQDANALAVHSAHLACPVQKLDLAASDPSIPQSARIDVLLAGSPCQGFSTLGQRRVDDPRNSLPARGFSIGGKAPPEGCGCRERAGRIVWRASTLLGGAAYFDALLGV